MEGEAAMSGHSRAGVYASHLSATYFCYCQELMKDETDDAVPYRVLCTNDEMSDSSWQIW